MCTNSLIFYFFSINSLKLHIKLGNINPSYLTKNISHNAMENLKFKKQLTFINSK